MWRIPGLRDWIERRTLAALRDSASHLGLKRDLNAEVHTGTLDGVEVLVGASLEAVHVGSPYAKAIPVAPLTAVARLPTPLGFKLSITSAADAGEPTLRTRDQPFDRRAAVFATDPAAAGELLASAMLRRRIRLLLERSRRGHATITDTLVAKSVFDAHRSEFPAATRAAREVAAVAKALSRREQLRRREAHSTEPERVADLLIGRLEQALPGFDDLRLSGAAPVPVGVPLREACDFADWISDADVTRFETPQGLPRQPLVALTPEGLVRVHVECDEGGFHDGRNTWYSYNGYHLTLLVSRHDGEIWDARWERTDY